MAKIFFNWINVLAAVICLATVATVFTGCDPKNDDITEIDNGESGDGGDGNSGTVVASQYRRTMSVGPLEYVWDNQQSDWDQFDLVSIIVAENTITWTPEENEPITDGEYLNVSTGPDHPIIVRASGVNIGTWAYVYSGNDKIGVVLHTTNDNAIALLIGARTEFGLTTYRLGYKLEDLITSDIKDGIRNIYVQDDPRWQ